MAAPTKHFFQGVGRYSELVIDKAKGSWLYTTDGKKILDFTCGIAVTNLGHSHPRIVKAIQKQAEDAQHIQIAVGFHKPMLQLADKLIDGGILPKQLDKVFFVNSGAEAVENAMKLARHATKRPNFIVFQGGFHGRTFATMGLTSSKTNTKAGFSPFLAGIHIAPYPQEAAAIDHLELMFKQQTTPAEVAGIIIEPVLGEGGYLPASPAALQRLRGLCDKHGILLIFDEIQSGYGRTGTMFALEQAKVVPDILLAAKGIANGLPLSLVASRGDLTKSQPSGSMGGTYAGNVLACAAACEVIDIFRDEKILENVKERSAQLFSFLKSLDRKKYGIRDVRGLGLMVGVEFDDTRHNIAHDVITAALKNNLFLMTASAFEVIRFMPPLNVTKQEMEQGCQIFKASLDQVCKK